eukprot:m.310677 g.310677  ORF g.310677 m.310677 type:complete len:464 (+) comp53753_c0_seq1:114-1505(+)
MSSQDDTNRRCYLSPSKSRQPYADRFIPSRSACNLASKFEEFLAKPSSSGKRNGSTGESDAKALCPSSEPLLYSSVLDNEASGRKAGSGRVLQFRSPAKNSKSTVTWSPYTLSPLSQKNHRLLQSPRKRERKIAMAPYKILDAPELQDDFYLNLLDWSSQNVLSVGLGSCVYLWNAGTSEVTQLCDLASEDDEVASVGWCDKGATLAIGTKLGVIQLWDVKRNKNVNSLSGHASRVSSLAWSGEFTLASGSRDRKILYRDTRTSHAFEHRLVAHAQEVCGLKWSGDRRHLASGGNDNKLFVWSRHTMTSTDEPEPLQCYGEHVAAVKAIAWSPHQHGLLASGGGTTDRCIRFWNTLTGHKQPLQCIDTNSQVCNLAWSKNANELVSTHGYSQNLIVLWKYPSMQQLAKLTGHTTRVLYLGVSPDGQSIVTGAGDETLRFWDVFNKACYREKGKTALDAFAYVR